MVRLALAPLIGLLCFRRRARDRQLGPLDRVGWTYFCGARRCAALPRRSLIRELFSARRMDWEWSRDTDHKNIQSRQVEMVQQQP
jgi:hypothetical protein